MCTNCGCSAGGEIGIHPARSPHSEPVKPHAHHGPRPDHDDHHHHDHHHHSAAAGSPPSQTLEIHARLLAKNNHRAQHNRDCFRQHQLLVLNLLSSPGSGKTTLLQAMAQRRRSDRPLGVIVGDLATDNDAQRLQAAGAIAVQITTGTACHLEADQVAQALTYFDLTALDLLVIENVGNLVCPAAYDLGETLRVVLLSVTEGEDKPLKYPTAFQSADVVLVTKVDIAEAVGFDRALALHNIRRMAPQAQVFEVSARTGIGLTDWQHYLEPQIQTPSGSPQGDAARVEVRL